MLTLVSILNLVMLACLILEGYLINKEMKRIKDLESYIESLESLIKDIKKDYRTEGCSDPECSVCYRSNAVKERMEKVIHEQGT